MLFALRVCGVHLLLRRDLDVQRCLLTACLVEAVHDRVRHQLRVRNVCSRLTTVHQPPLHAHPTTAGVRISRATDVTGVKGDA